MSLTVEFTEKSVTIEEIRQLQQPPRPRILLREKPMVFPNGNVGFYLGYARLPGYAYQAPALPAELGARYSYREEIRDNGALLEGEYSYGDGIEMMIVQHSKDRDLVEKISNVEIIGADLKKMSQAFQHLRSGKLKPSVPYASSSGAIAAPAANESTRPPDDKKEASGTHALPPTAATATQAA